MAAATHYTVGRAAVHVNPRPPRNPLAPRSAAPRRALSFPALNIAAGYRSTPINLPLLRAKQTNEGKKSAREIGGGGGEVVAGGSVVGETKTELG